MQPHEMGRPGKMEVSIDRFMQKKVVVESKWSFAPVTQLLRWPASHEADNIQSPPALCNQPFINRGWLLLHRAYALTRVTHVLVC